MLKQMKFQPGAPQVQTTPAAVTTHFGYEAPSELTF
jgi:hypothetical protein